MSHQCSTQHQEQTCNSQTKENLFGLSRDSTFVISGYGSFSSHAILNNSSSSFFHITLIVDFIIHKFFLLCVVVIHCRFKEHFTQFLVQLYTELFKLLERTVIVLIFAYIVGYLLSKSQTFRPRIRITQIKYPLVSICILKKELWLLYVHLAP